MTAASPLGVQGRSGHARSGELDHSGLSAYFPPDRLPAAEKLPKTVIALATGLAEDSAPVPHRARRAALPCSRPAFTRIGTDFLDGNESAVLVPSAAT
jgi:hypothetical protein